MSTDQPGVTAPDSTSAGAPLVDTRGVDPGQNGGGPAAARRRRFIVDDQASDPPPPVATVPVVPPKPVSRRERKQENRLRARKVKRVVRHIDPWSVLKISLMFYFCLFIVLMVAGVLLWNLAAAAGTISDIEGFFKSAGAFETFSFDGFTIFRASLLIGLIFVIAGTGFNVLLTVLFNLVSDLAGGIRVTVIEEETARSSAEIVLPRS